jgi:RNA polymerase sigma factor (TIGR02999 family)
MPSGGDDRITVLAGRAQAGDPQAAAALLPAVYEELRRLAAQKLSQERPGQTLQATALVHEAYLRVIGPDDAQADGSRWQGRAHFFAAAAEAMRRILIDNARRKSAARHGGDHARVELDAAASLALAWSQSSTTDDELLALDAALDALSREDPAKAEVVKLRFFAGLTEPEVAAVMNLSRITVARYWRYARAWLFERVRGRHTPSPEIRRNPAPRNEIS